MRRRSHLATLAAAAIVVALAGCGGSSGGSSLTSFKSAFKAQKAQFTQLGTDLGTAITNAPKETNAQLASAFAALATRATQQAKDLRTLKPPSNYSAEVSRLAAEFDTIAGDLNAVAGDAKSNNAPAAKAAAEKLGKDSLALKATDEEVTRQLGLPQAG